MTNYCYSQLVDESRANITITLDLKEPVEILDFASLFASLGRQFDKYIAENHPDVSGQARIYIKEVRKGSIIAELVPQIKDLVDILDTVLMMSNFAGAVGMAIKKYISGERIPGATKSDLSSVADMVKSVAHDSDGRADLEFVKYDQGVWNRSLVVSFDTADARRALETLESHKRVLDKTDTADHERVLMVFQQSNIKMTSLGKRSGELVLIESLHPKPLPLIYASQLAEEQIKHEITEADDNIFKKCLDVDVNVELRDGKPVAYRVVHMHKIFDLPED